MINQFAMSWTRAQRVGYVIGEGGLFHRQRSGERDFLVAAELLLIHGLLLCHFSLPLPDSYFFLFFSFSCGLQVTSEWKQANNFGGPNLLC